MGESYTGLFHVSDWMPTILEMAGITYIASPDRPLDGVSHYNAFVKGDPSPRDYLLMNYYYDPYHPAETLWNGRAVGIRNSRYKLLHTYLSVGASNW